MSKWKNGNNFWGKADGPLLLGVATEYMEIRGMLGRDADLLDKYLLLYAKRLSAVDQVDAVRKGIGAFDRLVFECKRHAVEEVAPQPSPFTPIIMETIQAYPQPEESETIRAENHAFILAERYFHYIQPKIMGYFENRADKRVKVAELEKIRGKMAAICGGEALAKLDDAIRTNWQPATPVLLFQQGYVYAVLDTMSYHAGRVSRKSLSLPMSAVVARSKE